MGMEGLTCSGLVLSTRGFTEVFAITLGVFRVDSELENIIIKEPTTFLFDYSLEIDPEHADIFDTELKHIKDWKNTFAVSGLFSKIKWMEILNGYQPYLKVEKPCFSGFQMTRFVSRILRNYDIFVNYVDLSLIHNYVSGYGDLPWVSDFDDLYAFVDWGIKGYRIVDIVSYWCSELIPIINTLTGFKEDSDILECRWHPAWRAYAIGFVFREMFKRFCQTRPSDFNILQRFTVKLSV